MKIALDVMGGDNAPDSTIEGGLDALKECDDIFIYFVGPSTKINEKLDEFGVDDIKDRFEVVEASEVITNEEKPVEAIRKKKDSSLVKAVSLVRDNEADTAVTAGSTGAFMAAGYFVLRRIKGIDRPALAPIFPSASGYTIVLDVGSNMDAKPEHLLQYAKMGSIYAKGVFKIEKPTVGLLNVGTEEGKGNELTKKAYDLLKEADDINFKGNIEARDVPGGAVDVVVCDGFVGNVMLKFMEGAASFIFGSLKKEITKSFSRKVGAVMLKSAFSDFAKQMDYTEHGGAPLLGVKGALIKSHGSSDAKAIKNAILKQGKGLIESKVLEQFNNTI
ncbi:phosphate acyltransferase PlsX [Proteinivorax hydrogeniformans]|uniref:Phosphate acyltransferase n=1 Tax=Proteinivorax hydrogeniformans TaxID=1826727 RepID=A0AAU8HXC8_9FIRM